MFPLILSLVLGPTKNNNGRPRRENNKYARNLVCTADIRNCGITYQIRCKDLKSRKTGDGAAIVGEVRRAAVFSLGVRGYSPKAGEIARRGSERKSAPHSTEVNIKVISNIKNLITAYELIRSNPGNMSPGLDRDTLDGLTLGYLKKIQTQLRDGQFEFSPARRTHIPKPGKNRTRPLAVASPREKVVQKAILLVLERLYEPEFLDSSHGFRPKRGTHTAMKQLESQFQSAKYIIEADFSKAFDTIPHIPLLRLLSERIKCGKTLSLIRSGLKAGYFEFGTLYDNLAVGTPQGSILSPLLCNVYLHQLDKYMEEIKEQFNTGEKRKTTPEYMKLQNRAKYWRSRGYNISRAAEYNSLIKQLISTHSRPKDAKFLRISYVRYADDFVVGVEGSYKAAEQVLNTLESFVNNKLELHFNHDKTGIVEFSNTPVKFLGYNIRGPRSKQAIPPLETILINGRPITRRRKLRPVIEMDTEKVLGKLVANGFIRKIVSHKVHHHLVFSGTFRGNLVNLDHQDILNYYNSVITGIDNYYSFVRNRVAVARIE